VVSEQTNPVKGKFLEELGFYNPKLKSRSFDKDRILYWISKGAKCSATVNNLLISSEVIQGQKVHAWRPKKREVSPEAAKAEVKEEKKAPETKDKPAPEAKEEKIEEKPEAPEKEKEQEAPAQQ
jgi:ribosomal protein S16